LTLIPIQTGWRVWRHRWQQKRI